MQVEFNKTGFWRETVGRRGEEEIKLESLLGKIGRRVPRHSGIATLTITAFYIDIQLNDIQCECSSLDYSMSTNILLC